MNSQECIALPVRLPPAAVWLLMLHQAAQGLLAFASTTTSVAETCLYFSCDRADWQSSFLMLNGEGSGPINNLTFPTLVSQEYEPVGKSLICVVVLGTPYLNDSAQNEPVSTDRVQVQLVDWFGPQACAWKHLRTYRITHALPDQSPPTQNPTCPQYRIRPGLFVCGEQGSLPGIQWALLSGQLTAAAVIADLGKTN